MTTIQENSQDFNKNLLLILPEYQKHITLFSYLKVFNYYFYFFLFIIFLLFFLSFFVFELSISEELFNNFLIFIGSGFFISITFSFISFYQQSKIYKKISTNKTPIAFYTLLHSILFFLFLSTLTSATFSLFFTYLSFQMPYFIFMFHLEKIVKKEAEKLK